MKSGLVVLVGRSNVGKSTLMNTLVGTKIAATSFRAQLTRHIIHGVMNNPEGQAVFVDTPGIFKDKRSELTAKLTRKAQAAVVDIDVIVYVVDPTREIGTEERSVFGMIRYINKPKIMVINKSDLHYDDKKHYAEYEKWADEFDEVFHLSALKGSHITPLKNAVIDFLPEGEQLYPDDQLTNIDNYFWIAELIREKIFSVLDKELPYSVSVEVDNVEDKPERDGKPRTMVIKARILTDEERYKKMIIGKRGMKIKEIGLISRKELEQSTGTKVYLELEVEVDKHWVERL